MDMSKICSSKKYFEIFNDLEIIISRYLNDLKSFNYLEIFLMILRLRRDNITLRSLKDLLIMVIFKRSQGQGWIQNM